MAKKQENSGQPDPRKQRPEEVEEIIEIFEEDPEEIIEIIEEDEPEPAAKRPGPPPLPTAGPSARPSSPDVDLGAPVAKLEDGSDILEVEDAEIEFVEPEAKPAPKTAAPGPRPVPPPPPGARPRPKSGLKQDTSAPASAAKPLPPTVPPGKKAAPTTMPPSKKAAPTRVAPKQAQPTQLAPKQVQATQLAPGEEALGLSGAEPPSKSGAPAQPEGKRAAPTKMAPKQAQPTQLAPKQVQPTQLAPSDAALESTGEAGAKGPSSGFPNLSIDEPANKPDAKGVGDSGVIDLIDLTSEESSKSLPGGKVNPDDSSEVVLIAEEILGGESSVVQFDRSSPDKPSGVDIIAEELESQVGVEKKSSSVDMDEDALVHELVEGSESSAVDLGTAAATPPVPIEVGEDLLVTDEEMAALQDKKADKDLDETLPFTLAGDMGGTGDVVVDESLLFEEVGKEDAAVEDQIDLELYDKGAARPPKKKQKALVVETEDLVAAAEAEAEEVEEVAEVTEEDEGELVGVAAAKSKPAKKKKKDEDEEEDRPKKQKKPRYGRRWLGGALLGLLLAVGGVAAVWFLQPNLFVQLADSSPNPPFKPKAPPPGPKVTEVQKALEHINKGEFDEAFLLVQSAPPTDDEQLAVRGQAQWQKYYKEQMKNKAPLSKDDEPVKAALKDLEDAKKDHQKQQILDIIAKDQLAKQLSQGSKIEEDLKKLLAISDPKTDVAKAVSDLLATKKNLDTTLADLTKKKEELDSKIKDQQKAEQAVKNVLITEKVFAADDPVLKDLDKAVAKAVKERKDLGIVLGMINDKLKEAKITDKDAKGVEALIVARINAEKERAELHKAAEEAFKTINDGKPLSPGADLKKQLVEGASLLSEKAKAPLVNSMSRVVGTFSDLSAASVAWVQAAIDRSVAEAQLKLYQAREPLIESPEKKVDTWLTLFQTHGFKGAQEIDKAKKDLNWVTSPTANASAEVRAKATYLQGLLARNQEQFDQAKSLFGDALNQIKAIKPEPSWKAKATQALAELTDAKAYYLPAARALGQQPETVGKAIEQLNIGLKALPGDPHLHLEKALIQYRALPSAKPEPALVQAIRADAEAAKKAPATAPEAHFLLGQLEERVGALDKAMALYSQALAQAQAQKANKQDISRYQQAIGRLLLIDPDLAPAPAAAPAPEPAGKATSLRTPATGAERCSATVSLWASLAVLAVNAVDLEQPGDPDDAKKDAQVKKLLDAAEQYKKSEDPKVQGQGFMLYGLAQNQQGKRTEGLMNYVKGLKMYYPGIEAEHLQKLVETHPAFLIPDEFTKPNPVLAEAHFGAGTHLYFDGKYSAAEDQFRKAITYHKNDARYFYFLGLAQHAQKSKQKEVEARFNIEFGTKLEVQDLPPGKDISFSLERIQGSLRQYLNDLKAQARLAE